MRFLYCLNCFRAGYDGVRCPSCNYQKQGMGAHFSLAPGRQLKQRYWIGSIVNIWPLEQYYSTGNQGTWTDVYALASTYYYMVSGERVQKNKNGGDAGNPGSC